MNQHESGGCPMNRRRFLQTLGVGAAASSVTLVSGRAAGALATRPELPEVLHGHSTSFGRMFPHLPPFADPTDALSTSCTTRAAG